MIDNLALLLAASQGASGASGGSAWVQFLPIILIFLVFYFLLIRPQRKKQKETQKMISAVKKGDKVTTIGGIRGTVKKTSEGVVILEIDNKGNALEITRSAIASVNVQSTSGTDSEKEEPKKIEEEKN